MNFCIPFPVPLFPPIEDNDSVALSLSKYGGAYYIPNIKLPLVLYYVKYLRDNWLCVL